MYVICANSLDKLWRLTKPFCHGYGCYKMELNYLILMRAQGSLELALEENNKD